MTDAEDLSFFQEEVSGLFVMLGVTPKDKDPRTAAENHSPWFFANEAAMPNGLGQ